MKMLYITTVNMSEKSGVSIKVDSEINVMRKEGFDVQLVYPAEDKINFVESESTTVLGVFKKFPIFGFFKMIKKLYEVSFSLVQEREYEGVYIRYSLSDWNLIKFLKKLKSNGTKIFFEIASFPYDNEYKTKSFLKKTGLLIDKLYRNKLKNYVDYCFTPSKLDYDVFGIKTVFFDNGVDVKSVAKRNYVPAGGKTLRLLAVANLCPWHGYDRVIRGMSNYYENFVDGPKVIFNIVGEGMELENLKSLVQKFSLEEVVVFHGKKFGEELQEVYNSSEIGIGAIGMYRLGTDNVSSLKTKEYCLNSLPFISSGEQKEFEEGFKYVLKVENTAEPIDIDAVINFYTKIKDFNYIDEMRRYAEINLAWDIKFKIVTERMKSCV